MVSCWRLVLGPVLASVRSAGVHRAGYLNFAGDALGFAAERLTPA
jgi:hypothetical protein